MISEAFAQSAGGAAGGMDLAGFLPLVLIFIVFYFLLIRPQQKRMKEHKNLIANLRRGDNVVTSGGLVGKIDKVDETEVVVQIADGVKVTVIRNTIAEIRGKTEPADTKK